MGKFTQKHRVMSIVLACFQNMTLGGIFFGWASISGGLLVSSASEGGPGLSTNYVHMIFVVASFCNFLGPLILGIVLDSYGPRVCSVLSILLITIGSAMFALSDTDSLPLFVPGMCLIAFGGPGTQNAIIHLSNLFPEWKATATSFIVGSFQLSFVVFLVFDQLWAHLQYSYTTLFMGYCVLCVANVAVSLVMWPDEPYNLEDAIEEQAKQLQAQSTAPSANSSVTVTTAAGDIAVSVPERPKSHGLSSIRLPSVMVQKKHRDPAQFKSTHQYVPVPTQEKLEERPQYTLAPVSANSTSKHGGTNAEEQGLLNTNKTFDLKEASFNEQTTSPEFLYLTLFFLINSFWANFYLGTFDMQLGDKHNLSGEQRHVFAEYFTLVITLGVISIFPVGALMDRQGFPATSLLCIGSGVIWAVLLVLDSPERHLLMVSFVFYSVFRTSFYTFFFAYLADVLGFRYFGMLGGIIFLLAGIAGMLQIPLAAYGAGDCHILTANQLTCDKGNWDKINMVMVLMVASTLYFTYRDYVRRKQAEKSLSDSNANKIAAENIELGEMANRNAPANSKAAAYGAV